MVVMFMSGHDLNWLIFYTFHEKNALKMDRDEFGVRCQIENISSSYLTRRLYVYQSVQMEGNEEIMRFVPCEHHQKTQKRCLGVCPNGKWVPVESKRVVCDICLVRKKKCTHVAGKPALKTKRVQEEVPTGTHIPKDSKEKAAGGKTKVVLAVPTDSPASKDSKEKAAGGKTKVAPKMPVSSIAPEKTVLEDMPFQEQDFEVLGSIKCYGAYQDPKLVEEYRQEEQELEEDIFRNGLRELLAPEPE